MPAQVGGFQEVFVQLKAGKRYSIDNAIAAVERVGGRVLHAFPPSLMIVSVPQARVAGLLSKGGIAAIDTDSIPQGRLDGASSEYLEAAQAWNEHFNVDRRLRAMAAADVIQPWDVGNRQPPDPPREVQDFLRQREIEAAPQFGAQAAGAPNMNIPVLVGRIAVGLIFVDSTVAQYQITDAQKNKVVSETVEGLNLLSGFEPRAGIQWFYNIQRPKISLPASKFTAANKNSWEDLWRNAALQAMGYPGSLDGMNRYLSDLRTAWSCAWSYAIFVTKHPMFWFGYCWGNHVVMDFGVDGWGIDNFSIVAAHETGHIFGCPDEYASSGCNCTGLYGRYQVRNGNCENCATPSIPCLMSHNSPALCDFTRGHLGWNELAVQSKGTTILKGTWTFDLDTGVQGPAGGADMWWEQVDNTTRFLVPQSGAMFRNMGKPDFDAVGRQTLECQPYTASPINGSNNAANKLTPGTVVAVKTNAGRYAKVKIESYGYNLGIKWVTYK